MVAVVVHMGDGGMKVLRSFLDLLSGRRSMSTSWAGRTDSSWPASVPMTESSAKKSAELRQGQGVLTEILLEGSLLPRLVGHNHGKNYPGASFQLK